MIAHLYGKLVGKQPGVVILDTSGGIGYRIRISNHTYDRLPDINIECRLHIHHHISDNDQQLFGFSATEEMNLFELLITVKSVGPRLALALLSAMSPKHLINAIVDQNSALIAKSPGIGKKSAERIVLELRDKLGALVSIDESDSEGDSSDSIQYETVSALEALGYARIQAQNAVQTVIKKEESVNNVSELLKKALKFLQ